jgi:hypothetical protein
MDDAAVSALFLSKICDLKNAILRDCDCKLRRRNDLALDSGRQKKTTIQEKEGNYQPDEMYFVRHVPRSHISKLESIVVTSTGTVIGH